MCKFVIYIIFQNLDNYCLGHQFSSRSISSVSAHNQWKKMFSASDVRSDANSFFRNQINKLNTWLNDFVFFLLARLKRVDVEDFPFFQLYSAHNPLLGINKHFLKDSNVTFRKFIEHKIGNHVRRKLVTGKFNSINSNRETVYLRLTSSVAYRTPEHEWDWTLFGIEKCVYSPEILKWLNCREWNGINERKLSYTNDLHIWIVWNWNTAQAKNPRETGKLFNCFTFIGS